MMVTHDPEAASHADRLLVLRDGKVVHDGRRRQRRAGHRADEGRGLAVTKVALRGIAARKLRAFTTFLAIFLGVALVAGTFVLTDTINRSFDQIFSDSLKGTDVVITVEDRGRAGRRHAARLLRGRCSSARARSTASRPPPARSSRSASSSRRTATR